MRIFSVKLQPKSFSGDSYSSYDDGNFTQGAVYFDPKDGKVGYFTDDGMWPTPKFTKDYVRKEDHLSNDAEISVYKWSNDYDQEGNLDKYAKAITSKVKKAIKWAKDNGKTRVNFHPGNDIDALTKDLRDAVQNGVK